MTASPRLVRVGKTVLDLAVCAAAIGLAFAVRFEGWVVPDDYAVTMWRALPTVLAIKPAGLVALGLPRRAWRYSGPREAQRGFGALALAPTRCVPWRLAVPPLPGLP